MSFGLKKTLSHTAIYGIGFVVANIASLVMLPIYTRYLTPADYGLVELLAMMLDLTSFVFGMRVDHGLFRYYATAKEPAERNSIVSTVLLVMLALNACGVLVLIAFSSVIAGAVLGDNSLWIYVALYAPSLLGIALIAIPFNYLRLTDRPVLFVTLSVTKLFVQVGLNVLFVVVLDMKALGVVYAAVIAQLTLGALLSFFLLKHVGLRFDRIFARKLVRFSAPIMLSSFVSFYVLFADRYFLNRFAGLSAVGLYALAARFGFAFWSLFYEPFKRAWDSHKFQALSSPNPNAIYRHAFSLVTKALLTGALGVGLFIDDFLRVFVGPEFLAAGALVPIVVAAFVARPLIDFCAFGLFLREKTRHIGYGSALAAAVMTIGYLTLIPLYGATGAALTALVGAVTELWYVNRTATRYYDMGLEWRRFFATVAIVVGIVVATRFAMATTMVPFLHRVLIFIGTLLVVYLSPIVHMDERAIVRGAVQRLRAAISPRTLWDSK